MGFDCGNGVSGRRGNSFHMLKTALISLVHCADTLPFTDASVWGLFRTDDRVFARLLCSYARLSQVSDLGKREAEKKKTSSWVHDIRFGNRIQIM